MAEGVRVIPYDTIRQAIVGRQSLTAVYDNYVRHFSPHLLGRDRQQNEVLIGFQYGGGRPGGLPNAGDWCLFRLSALRGLNPNDDDWIPGPLAGKPCHHLVEIDVSA